jgi:hypothetical protein
VVNSQSAKNGWQLIRTSRLFCGSRRSVSWFPIAVCKLNNVIDIQWDITPCGGLIPVVHYCRTSCGRHTEDVGRNWLIRLDQFRCDKLKGTQLAISERKVGADRRKRNPFPCPQPARLHGKRIEAFR